MKRTSTTTSSSTQLYATRQDDQALAQITKRQSLHQSQGDSDPTRTSPSSPSPGCALVAKEQVRARGGRDPLQCERSTQAGPGVVPGRPSIVVETRGLLIVRLGPLVAAGSIAICR